MQSIIKSKPQDFFNEEIATKFEAYINKISFDFVQSRIDSLNLYIEVLPHLYGENHQMVGLVM